MSVIRMKVLFSAALAVLLVGLAVYSGVESRDVKPASVALAPRSNETMKAFEQKLQAVQPGDLLVMIDAQENGAPSIEKVVGLEEGGFSIRGVPNGWNPPVRKFAYYHAFHKTQGAVHIIPKERIESFYLQVGSAAFMQEVH